jgi:hypothetical protein
MAFSGTPAPIKRFDSFCVHIHRMVENTYRRKAMNTLEDRKFPERRIFFHLKEVKKTCLAVKEELENRAGKFSRQPEQHTTPVL